MKQLKRSKKARGTDATRSTTPEEIPHESEETFRALVERAAEGILVADVETKKFLYANPAMSRMLGYATEELEQLSVEDIHPREELDGVLSEFMAQARGEKILAPDIPCRRKDG
ncbi:MAG: PAS domain S-box protein, partial [Ignavibacteriae bacterium]|nr:PAS domain S-box protein [Ignavibacteriota bacterium]